MIDSTLHSLKSKYTDSVNQSMPLNDYPRPHLQRDEWTNLNGWYDYAIMPIDSDQPFTSQGKILVPFCIESLLSGVIKPLLPQEKLIYHRIFDLKKQNDKRCLLHFEAVDYETDVSINNHFIGKHKGGYLSFSFDITDWIQDGTNELMIAVKDPTDSGDQERGKQVLNPKGIWYTATSGIWQTVWIEWVFDLYIRDIKIISDINKPSIRLNPMINDDVRLPSQLTIYQDKKMLLEETIYTNEFTEIIIPNAQLWTPETPYLYDFKLTLIKNHRPCDSVRSYFGLRSISIQSDANGIPRIYLNHRPYFMSGVLDQGYYPDGLLTSPTDQAMIDDIQLMKTLGFNLLRKHIKVEPARWYYHCDRLGMLVWQDMPSGGYGQLGSTLAVALPNIGIHINDSHYRWFHRQNSKGRFEFENQLKQMISQLYNHPSIVVWVPFNEGWGQFDAKRIATEIKKLDPSRLVDHASGWHDQNGLDFTSIHKYIFDVKKPKKSKIRPFVLSEFGGYSYNIKNHVWNEEKSFGYRMFSSSQSLTDAYETLIREQILPLIKKGLCATVYTQLSDVELEVNGLITYDRTIEKMERMVVQSLNEQMKTSL